jgi:radical SAM enzyme (TIGR01210 family)
MCDLWKHTLTHMVPIGAIPQQIDYALQQLGRARQVKLYNSGSFFDPTAIPLSDYPAIANTLSFAEHTIVESHPRLIGDKAVNFRDRLDGTLEVAIGLETVHPAVLPRLNKKFDPQHFSDAARFLADRGIAVRAFVLVKPPFLGEEEAVEWALKSVEFAFSCGASAVSLIPTRPGNGALDRLMETGEFSPPRLSTLERAHELGLNLARGRVFADLWNLEQFSACPVCFAARRHRLQSMNLSQQVLPRIECEVCGAVR